jgi:hypothetical protein
VQQEGKCALTGRKMTLGESGTKKDKDLLSVDRINHNLPHVKGNVRLVTYQANLARNIFTDEELLEFCWDVVTKFHNESLDDKPQDVGSLSDS